MRRADTGGAIAAHRRRVDQDRRRRDPRGSIRVPCGRHAGGQYRCASSPHRFGHAAGRGRPDVRHRAAGLQLPPAMTVGVTAAQAQGALKCGAPTTVGRFALQLAAQVALARMLGPGNFGVYGIGMTVLTFVAFLSGASFSWNLMLMPSVSDDDVRFAFTWQLLAG